MNDESKIIKYSNCKLTSLETFINLTTHYLHNISSNPTLKSFCRPLRFKNADFNYNY